MNDVGVTAERGPWRNRISDAVMFLFPPVEWGPKATLKSWQDDFIAGVVVGVMLLPQSLSYASLAEMPLQRGIFCAMTAKFAFGLFGTCPHLSNGPIAELMVILLAIKEISTAQRTTAFTAIALQAGLLSIFCGLTQIGSILRMLLAKSVGDGYMCAVAVVVVLLQIPAVFNIPGSSSSVVHEAIPNIIDAFKANATVNSVYSSLLCLAYILYLGGVKYIKSIPPWIPHQLIVIIVSTLVTYVARLDKHIDLGIVQDLPSGLPDLEWPSWSNVGTEIPYAVVVVIVAFLQSYSTAGTLGDERRPNQMLYSNGMVNVAAGLFQGFPAGASPGRSAIMLDRKAASPGASFFSGILMLLSAVLLTRIGTFYYLPKHALACILITAVSKLFNLSEPLHLLRVSPGDAAIWFTTFIATLFLGIAWGVACGVCLSLLLVIVRVARPRSAVIGYASQQGNWREIEEDPEILVHPRVLVWRFYGPLLFINHHYFEESLRQAICSAGRPVDVVIVHFSKVTDIDAAAMAALPNIVRDIQSVGISHSGERIIVFFAEFDTKVEPLLRGLNLSFETKDKSDDIGQSMSPIVELQALEVSERKVIESVQNSHWELCCNFWQRICEIAASLSEPPAGSSSPCIDVMFDEVYGRTFIEAEALHCRNFHDEASRAQCGQLHQWSDRIRIKLDDAHRDIMFSTLAEAIRTARRVVDDVVRFHDGEPNVPRPAVSYIMDVLASRQREERLDASVSAPEVASEGKPFAKKNRKLIGILAVVRHADRTPKQKIKVQICSRDVLRCAFPQLHCKSELKFKFADEHTQSILRSLLPYIDSELVRTSEAKDKKYWKSLKKLLVGAPEGLRLQLKPTQHDNGGNVIEGTLVCKWGGTLTPTGILQAHSLGLNLMSRFVASGEIDATTLREFTKSPCIITNSEDRVVSTAIETLRGLTGHTSGTHGSHKTNADEEMEEICIDDEALGNAHQVVNSACHHIIDKESPAASVFAIDNVREVQHYRHVPGLLELVKLPNLDRPTPRASLRRAVELVCSIQLNLEFAQSDPDGTSPSRESWDDCNSQFAALYELESMHQFRERWKAVGEALCQGSRYQIHVIPRLADMAAYDEAHNLEILKHFFEPAIHENLSELYVLALHLSEVYHWMTMGPTAGMQFVNGAVIASKLLGAIEQRVTAVVARDSKSSSDESFVDDQADVSASIPIQQEPFEYPLQPRFAVSPATPLTPTIPYGVRAFPTSRQGLNARLVLMFTDQSHVQALQNCFFNSLKVPTFVPAPHGTSPTLSHYVTHVVFKIHRTVEQRSGSSDKDAVDTQYSIEILLSTGMVLAAQQARAHYTKATECAQLMPLTRIHSGMAISVFRSLVDEVQETAAVENDPCQEKSGVKKED